MKLLAALLLVGVSIGGIAIAGAILRNTHRRPFRGAMETQIARMDRGH